MKLRWLGAALALALVIALWMPGGALRPEAAVPGARTSREALEGGRSPEVEPAVDPQADLLPPPPARDIFRYAEPTSAPSLRTRVEPAPSSSTPAPPVTPPPALRFVGFVRRPGGLRAALATASGVVVVGPGDVVLGHTVLALDEDRGLRLRAPDGMEQTLLPGR